MSSGFGFRTFFSWRPMLVVSALLVLLPQPQSLAADTIKVLTEYDQRGQVLRSSLPHKASETVRWREYRYDSLDRQIRIIHPDGRSVVSDYFSDIELAATQTTDEAGRRQISYFDAFGNEVHRDRFDGNQVLRTSYSYDVLNRLRDIQDGLGSTFWYDYDGHGSKVFDVDPDLGCREFSYDTAGRLVRQTSADGALLSFEHDKLDRVTGKTIDKTAIQYPDCRFEIVPGTKTESGSSSSDVLDAGIGRLSDVVLKGGVGDDTYLISTRAGHVTIPVDAEGANGGFDKIRFVDLTLAQLTVSKDNDPQLGEVLAFTWNRFGSTGSLKIANLAQYIERIEFSDGSAVSKIVFETDGRLDLRGSDDNDLMIGSAGDDTLRGGNGNDTLEAGLGTGLRFQPLQGRNGNDTYVIGSDDGNILMNEAAEWDGSGTDTLRFKDLTLRDLSIFQGVDNGKPVLRMTWSKGPRSGEVRLADLGAWIEKFEFADGTTLSKIVLEADGRLDLRGSDSNDLIVGSSGDDTLRGGNGNDVLDAGLGTGVHFQPLMGRWGDDSYLIESDDGNILLNAAAEWDGSGHDTIRFKDLTLSEMTVKEGVDNGQPVLRFLWTKNGSNGELRLADLGAWYENFRFADGSAVSKISVEGEGRLVLTGGPQDDLIVGSATDDILRGWDGDDILDAMAGTGNNWQHLQGKEGNDTYLIGSDAGLVWMNDDAETSGSGALDTVQFKDLILADLTVTNDMTGDEPVLRLRWNKDGRSGELRLADNGAWIERYEFADGLVTGSPRQDGEGRPEIIGSPGDDVLIGSSKDDIIKAGDGDDTLDARAGTGSNWQHLQGQNGNDTYLIAANGGLIWMNDAAESSGSGALDTVRFTNLTLSELTVTEDMAGDEPILRFKWNKDGQPGELRIADRGAWIERFEFADGSAVSDIVFEREGRLDLRGTDGHDLIIGSAIDDILKGVNGNDILDAAKGTGNNWQHLQGGKGNDTYLIGSDGGLIWMNDDAEWDGSGTDTVRFKDLTLSNLTVTEDMAGDEPILRFRWNKNGRSGELRLADRGAWIEWFEFADGNVLSLTELRP